MGKNEATKSYIITVSSRVTGRGTLIESLNNEVIEWI